MNNVEQNLGWFKMHRALFKKAVWKTSSPEQKTILITLLSMVNYTPNEWEFKGEKFVCQPGQMITSLKSITKEAGKNISIKNVRTALVRFEKYGFLANVSAKQNRLITIYNWGTYQANDNEGGKVAGKQPANSRQTTGKQPATIKESKERKKERSNTTVSSKSIIFDFEKGDYSGTTPKDMDNWVKAYPAVDIEQAILRSGQWLLANPEKRKKNYRRFITNWLSREQERGGGGYKITQNTISQKQREEDELIARVLRKRKDGIDYCSNG